PWPGDPRDNLLCPTALTSSSPSSISLLLPCCLTSLFRFVSRPVHAQLTTTLSRSPSSSKPAPPTSTRALPPIGNPNASMDSSLVACRSATIKCISTGILPNGQLPTRSGNATLLQGLLNLCHGNR